MQTLGDGVSKWARLLPDKPAVICSGRVFSYAELNAEVNRLANALVRAGHTAKEDRVAILANNCHRHPQLHFAAAKIGSTVVPLNVRLIARELLFLINDAEVRTLLVSRDLIPVLEPVKDQFTTVENLVCLDGEVDGWTSLEGFLSAASEAEPRVEVSEDDVIFQYYTSGTTGRPKGAMLTHRNFISGFLTAALECGFSTADTNINALPVWHVGGATNMHGQLFMGGTNIMVYPADPPTIISSIQRYKVTWFAAIPKMLQAFALHQAEVKADCSSLRFVLYTASPMPPDVLEFCRNTFDIEYYTGYGQTETILITYVPVTSLLANGCKERRLLSCGRETYFAQIRIVDEEDRDVAPGHPGEIVTRGPMVMKGYWKMPEATAEALRGGWLHTGDVGYMDPDGMIYLLDRTKDMIRSGAESIFPREVEAVIEEHPAVQEAAVVSAPDEEWGEVPVAIVVLKEGQTATVSEIVDHCLEHLARFKRPRQVIFRTEPLPRNFTGKLLRKELREGFWKGHDLRIG